MLTLRPLKSAWVIRWIGTGANVPEGLVAVLNYRRAEEQVALVVEQVYAATSASDDEKVFYARRKSNNPYPAVIEAFRVIHCGPNPFLCAEFVRNLRKENGKWIWDDAFTPQERDAIQKHVEQNRRAQHVLVARSKAPLE
jgi:hypothetical protein